ncbi:MAG: hypothetical protein LBK95_07620 [Bifidobacteriaceae bacterium]|jgi:hypothetical protein|nr:hypothetical protein [Bifidobacteriaceae bacterium]
MANLQVKNFPDDLHESLAKRARDEGRTMSACATEELSHDLSRPTMNEWFARIDALFPPGTMDHIDSAKYLREARQEYDPDERFPIE